MKKIAALLFGLSLLAPIGAQAQSTGRVVQDCATGVPVAYTPGSTQIMTLLPTGQACVSGTGGGGGGGTSSTFGVAFPSTGTAAGFSDGTNMVAGRVKAASTAPVATDPSIVVTQSPNSPLSVAFGAQGDAVAGSATATASLIALIKYLNTAAIAPVPVSVNGTATAQSGVTQGTTPSGNATAAASIDTPLSINGTDCSSTPTTSAASFITASRLNKKVLIKVEGANAVCFNRTGGTATVGSAGTFCLKGATTANAGDGGSYSTPVGMSDEQGWSAIAVTGSSYVYCSRQ